MNILNIKIRRTPHDKNLFYGNIEVTHPEMWDWKREIWAEYVKDQTLQLLKIDRNMSPAPLDDLGETYQIRFDKAPLEAINTLLVMLQLNTARKLLTGT